MRLRCRRLSVDPVLRKRGQARDRTSDGLHVQQLRFDMYCHSIRKELWSSYYPWVTFRKSRMWHGFPSIAATGG
jgi:hypothetical protein